MADHNLYSTNQESNLNTEEVKSPNIRTMSSDVSEYAKSKNLSQVSIAAEELERATTSSVPEQGVFSGRRTNVVIAILGTLAVIAIAASAGVYFYYTANTKPKSEETKPATAVYFSSEKLETTTLSPQENLTTKLNASAAKIQPNRTIQRISVFLAGEGGMQTPLNANNFFRLLRIPAPALVAGDTDIMPFLYYQDGVTRMGFLIPVRDNNLALQTMLSWEASIQKNIAPLFLQELPETAAASFEDKIFKNINYRFVKLARSKDFGIGYFVFPAKHYLVVTTSETSLQSVITRLFEAK